MAEKIVLAYSGGLDTSVAIRWLKEDRGYDVVALTVDVGMDRSREELQSRAMAAGAVKYVWRDAQDEFVRHFAFPALSMAGARYQGHVPAGHRALASAHRAGDGGGGASRRRDGSRPRLHRQGERPGAHRCRRAGAGAAT